MAGRPTKPDALKIQQGTLRPSRVNKNQPVPLKIEELPQAPEYLNEIGRKQWDLQVDQLDRLGMLAKTDYSMLTAYCYEWSLYINYLKREEEQGGYYSTMSAEGTVTSEQIHPVALLADRHLKRCIEIGREFGFTPASRSKISVPVNTNQANTTVKRLLKSS